MRLESQSDHIALLSLMLVGTLTKRLAELGHLDTQTADHIHRLVQGVRIHAKHAKMTDLNVLFDNIENSLEKKPTRVVTSIPSWPAIPHH